MDKEFLGERRRALEEEYFARLNRALLDRLRAAEAADAKSNEAHGLDDFDEDSSDRHGTFAAAFDSSELELAGLQVTLRPRRADDLARYSEFVTRVARRDLSLRFGDDAEPRTALARLVQAKDDFAFIATIAGAGSEFEIVGDARAWADPHPYAASAEFAVVIRSDMQRLGLGRALLEKLIEGCRARGVELLYGLVAPSNRGMLALSRSLGFEVEHVPGGTTAVVSLHLPPRARHYGLAAERFKQGSAASQAALRIAAA